MIVLSLNTRGFRSPSTRIPLVILVELHKHDVIFLEEILGEGKKVIGTLEKNMDEWKFLYVEATGNLGGLIIWWKKSIPILNPSFQVSRLNS